MKFHAHCTAFHTGKFNLRSHSVSKARPEYVSNQLHFNHIFIQEVHGVDDAVSILTLYLLYLLY